MPKSFTKIFLFLFLFLFFLYVGCFPSKFCFVFGKTLHTYLAYFVKLLFLLALASTKPNQNCTKAHKTPLLPAVKRHVIWNLQHTRHIATHYCVRQRATLQILHGKSPRISHPIFGRGGVILEKNQLKYCLKPK